MCLAHPEAFRILFTEVFTSGHTVTRGRNQYFCKIHADYIYVYSMYIVEVDILYTTYVVVRLVRTYFEISFSCSLTILWDSLTLSVWRRASAWSFLLASLALTSSCETALTVASRLATSWLFSASDVSILDFSSLKVFSISDLRVTWPFSRTFSWKGKPNKGI